MAERFNESIIAFAAPMAKHGHDARYFDVCHSMIPAAAFFVPAFIFQLSDVRSAFRARARFDLNTASPFIHPRRQNRIVLLRGEKERGHGLVKATMHYA